MDSQILSQPSIAQCWTPLLNCECADFAYIVSVTSELKFMKVTVNCVGVYILSPRMPSGCVTVFAIDTLCAGTLITTPSVELSTLPPLLWTWQRAQAGQVWKRTQPQAPRTWKPLACRITTLPMSFTTLQKSTLMPFNSGKLKFVKLGNSTAERALCPGKALYILSMLPLSRLPIQLLECEFWWQIELLQTEWKSVLLKPTSGRWDQMFLSWNMLLLARWV